MAKWKIICHYTDGATSTYTARGNADKDRRLGDILRFGAKVETKAGFNYYLPHSIAKVEANRIEKGSEDTP